MARAKKIIRKSEREALKERRRSGEFKQDKKDARAAGLSRGEARKRAKRLSRVQALSKRKAMRADMAAKREEDASVSKMFADRRRMEAKRGGQKLAYESKSAASPAKQREMAPGGTPTKRLIGSEKVTFDKTKGMYKITGGDGYVRYSQSKPEIIKRRKNRAMYGAKVKVKKAQKGAAMGKSGKIPSSVVEKQQKLVDKITKQYNANKISIYPQGSEGKEISKKLKEATLKLKELKGSGSGRIYKVNKKGKALNEAPFKKYMNYEAKKAEKGAALKSVPSDAKGLSKLPKSVRNKMGYAKDGGKVKAMYGASMKKKAMYGAKMKKK